MRFVVLTIFPELFPAFWGHGIIGRAMAAGQIQGETVNPRDFAIDRHRTVDDRPYGGGCGMVMKPEPLVAAIRSMERRIPDARTALMSPRGIPFSQAVARELAASPRSSLILVCGRYEGVDERVSEAEIDIEISIGDYVLTGGELAAMVVIDAVTRLLPEVLGGAESAAADSFAGDRLEHPHFTRPPDFEGKTVPSVLLSGHHGEIDRWRQDHALLETAVRRPDLLADHPLSSAEREALKQWGDRIARIIGAEPLSGADPPSGGQ